jgi:hypothetical protein
MLARFGDVIVTPNTLTEASNLLSQHGEPERSHLLGTLKAMIHNTKEVVVASVDASEHPAFERLGLADAALLEAIAPKTPLLTVDLDLYLEAVSGGEQRAYNFNHMRYQSR